MIYPETEKIRQLIGKARRILIMQADNPDADSLASALALEHIFGDMGKEPYLYCGMHVPDYLRYLDGWDRVSSDLPSDFDLTVIVDTSADSLFGILNSSGSRSQVAAKPCVVIDHHAVQPSIPYASVVCSPRAVATGEVIYELSRQLDWPLSQEVGKLIVSSILADSLGLTSEGTTARSIHIIGELVESGVNIAELDNKRRELMRKSPELIEYKGRLLQRIEYFSDGRVAVITIPWEEIEKYSYAYNPSMLVIDDMRSAIGVDVAIAFKLYKEGKITAKIRCNFGRAVAGELAANFGGGGHPYASGFKVDDGRAYNEIKSKTIALATELLDNLAAGNHGSGNKT